MTIFARMNETIDGADRLVVAKSISRCVSPASRHASALPSDDSGVKTEPTTVTFQRSGSLVVAVPTQEPSVLTQSDVAEATIEGRRDDHGDCQGQGDSDA